MHYTIERLLNGDPDVVRHYQIARDKWRELFETQRDASVEEWAQWITDEQIAFFEHSCGGRWPGQEVMAWSGFGALYSTEAGFDTNRRLAEKLAEAFGRSMVSIEVKGHARSAAASYGVVEEEDA